MDTNNQTIPSKGYLIANFTIHDEETFKKYIEAGGSLAAKFNGKVISFDGKPDVVEGSAEAIMAIMEFDTLADAKRFYNSPEYTAARQFRIASTTGTIVLVEGL
jgi:uncharacterized protein (DUF1330 family)